MVFRDELQSRLERLLEKHGLDGDVAGAIDAYLEVYEDVLDATQGQWALFETVINDLAIADRVIATPELELLIQYMQRPPTEPLDDEAIALCLPFDDFPADAKALCTETGFVVALEGNWSASDYSEVEALLVTTGEPKPGDAGTRQYVIVTRDTITKLADPLAYLDALLESP